MPQRNSVPAAIEGRSILIEAQKITSSGTPLFTTTDDMVFPVKTSIRGSGTITQSYEPRIARFRDYSELNEEDEILGQNLWGFATSPITSINVGGRGRTGRHSGQDTILNGDIAFLEIVMGYRGLPLPKHPRLDLLLLP